MRTGTMLLRLVAILLFVFALVGGILSLATATVATAALVFIGGLTAGGLLWALAEGLEILRRVEANSRPDAPRSALPVTPSPARVQLPAVETAPPERIPAALPTPVQTAPELLETQPALPAVETQPFEPADNAVRETPVMPAAAAVYAIDTDTDSAVASPLPHVWQTRRTIFVLGVVLLLVGQIWASVVHWLNLPPDIFSILYPISCGVLACGPHLPTYFNLVLPLLGVAMLLLGVAMRPTALRATRDIVLQTLTPVRNVGQLREVAWGMAVISVVASIVAAVSAFTSPDRYPPVPLWVLAIVLWGVTFYLFDRAYHRTMPLSRSGVARFVAYFILLLILGFIYHVPIMDSLVVRVVFVALAALIVVGMWRERYLSTVSAAFVLIAVIGMGIYTYNFTSWRYSFIGDEYAFQQAAVAFLNAPEMPNILAPRWVYDAHPAFATFIQAVSMAVYGGDIYSWRISDVILVFLSAPMIYAVVRQLKSKAAGVLAAILFVSAHHLLAFTHIGANNLHSLPSFTAMLALALIGLESRSKLALFLCGVAAAFSFYNFSLTIPLIPLPLLLFALWVLLPGQKISWVQRIRAMFPLALVFAIAVIVMALPRLSNTSWLENAGQYTVASSELTNLSNPLLEQILPNALYALGGSLYFDNDAHYISGANIDPLTSFLMLAGVAGLLAIMTKRVGALWLVLSFLITTFLAGGLVPYGYPGHSRTFLLITFYAILAAFGSAFLWESIRVLGVRVSLTTRRAVFAVGIIAVVALNAYQFFQLSERDIPKTVVAMLFRELEETSPQTTIYIASRYSNAEAIAQLVDANRYPVARTRSIVLASPVESLTEVRNTAPVPYRVVIAPDLENAQAWYDAAKIVWADREVQTIYDDAGKQNVTIVDVPG